MYIDLIKQFDVFAPGISTASYLNLIIEGATRRGTVHEYQGTISAKEPSYQY